MSPKTIVILYTKKYRIFRVKYDYFCHNKPADPVITKDRSTLQNPIIFRLTLKTLKIFL